MRIGGYQPCSFSDFPGRLAAVVFTQGCNFRCPFCHNARLLPTKGDIIPTDVVLNRLRARRLQLDGVVITGGEPTLQDDLPWFVTEVRRIGLKVKLDTNGSRPEVLRSLIEAGLLDYIAMDIKAPWSLYDKLAGLSVPVPRLRESASLIAASGIAHEFRTTVVTILLADADLTVIRSQIPKQSPYRTQLFRPQHALDPALRKEADRVHETNGVSQQIGGSHWQVSLPNVAITATPVLSAVSACPRPHFASKPMAQSTN